MSALTSPMRAAPASPWTLAGLLLALLGVPAIGFLYRATVAVPTDGALVVREVAIFALTAIVLWIVLRRERRGLSSIGLDLGSVGRSLGRGLLLTLVLFAAVVGLLAAYSALGIGAGHGSAIAASVPATMLIVLRAGICEEILYRGFAIERLQELTGSKWIAAAISLALFAGFHFRQGPAGVGLVLLLGGLLTTFYLWKRDLLAAITAHVLVDFVPNILLPALGGEG